MELDTNTKTKTAKSLKNSEYVQNSQIYSSDKATVEVTVKLKKRKKDKKRSGEPVRQGSWADVFSRPKPLSSVVDGCDLSKEVKHDSRGSHKSTSLTSQLEKSDVRRIDLTDELYLEARTVVKPCPPKPPALVIQKERVKSAKSKETIAGSKSSLAPSTSSASNAAVHAHWMLEKDNELLRREVSLLRREIDTVAKSLKEQRRATAASLNTNTSFIRKTPKSITGARSSTQTQTQTDGRPKSVVKTPTPMQSVTTIPSKSDKRSESYLLIENDCLRNEAGILHVDLRKAKKDREDYKTTIKELYELASTLKQENNYLQGVNQDQESLHKKLFDAITENVTLKRQLEVLILNSPANTVSPAQVAVERDEVKNYRLVVQDLRTQIAAEMENIEQGNLNTGYSDYELPRAQSHPSWSATPRSGTDPQNVSYTAELYRILQMKMGNLAEAFPTTEDCEIADATGSVHSSTQYLELGVPTPTIHHKRRHYVPSLHASSNTSLVDKYSTPMKQPEDVSSVFGADMAAFAKNLHRDFNKHSEPGSHYEAEQDQEPEINVTSSSISFRGANKIRSSTSSSASSVIPFGGRDKV